MVPDWPYILLPNEPRLAWGVADHLVATSIPIGPADMSRPIRQRAYWAALADRLAWMLAKEQDWRAGAAELAHRLDDLGAWNGPHRFESPQDAAHHLLLDNMAFPDLMRCAVPDMPDFPLRMLDFPGAAAVIATTDLSEWMGLALP